MNDLDSLTLTIYGEARGEPIEGQVAVGSVIRNRVKREKKSYAEICHAPKQFSCWNEDDPNRSILIDIYNGRFFGISNAPTLLQCWFIAGGIINNQLMDNTHGSLNYLSTDLFNSQHRPSWALNVTHGIEKGNQVFFTA